MEAALCYSGRYRVGRDNLQVKEEVVVKSGRRSDRYVICRNRRRQLSIPRVRERILQTAARLVFEASFLPCSYGFRPTRSAHQALEAIPNSSPHHSGPSYRVKPA